MAMGSHCDQVIIIVFYFIQNLFVRVTFSYDFININFLIF